MAYVPKTWTTGDAVEVADLQHLETQYSEISTDLAAHVTAGHPEVYYPKTDMDSYFWHAGNDGDGSGLDADTLSGLHSASISGGVASGIMFWWYPGNGDIPAGYYFCDGDNGTLDMRSRFPIGASGTLAVGSTVGNATVTAEGSATIGACTLTVPQIFHTHTLLDSANGGTNRCQLGSGSNVLTVSNDGTGSTGYAGSGNSHIHPGTFVGDAKSLDPLFQYLVIIQKS